ncbi:MAG: hypothetical protein LN414_07760 [Candidatus Thermoplasmatota archaeon]|nr:hypothetical protein [Candidatus Thermoplasmatota archaeon]
MATSERTVWGAILAVFVAIGLIACAAYLYDSLSYDPPEPKNFISFSPPVLDYREVEGINNTDVSVEVQKLTPKDDRYKWSELRISITLENGTIILKNVKPTADDPSRYSTGAYPQIEVWYIDSFMGTDDIDPGDSIKVTGISEDLQLAVVKLRLFGRQVGSFSVPPYM